MDASTSAAERAYRTIRDGILNGAHKAGAMLGEEGLAQEIGVSRTPVRAALGRLQDEGWIVIYPKRGALVQGLSERAIADLQDTRLILEAAGASRISATVRDQLAARLHTSIDAQRDALAERDVRRFIELTIGFHRTFVEAAGNDVLLELNDRLADRQRFLLFCKGDHLLARCDDIIAEHVTLVEQLRTGDTDGFTETLRKHLDDNYKP
ncbi:putative GntR-family transcriptional regulator [Actinoplanes missouriensis 431]|uniref:Putative GntR-family transcriptional regulator n=1 Tax=Actinoplanes missouriensis (strain ATCC 14538 / DSM 43046 / CBS 188.64 / JCM 3121 / NBRC 102363 / NCIMB 12654 / NRRL B-3342 / UNCC 431) TaxID=512565 RepID=I0H5E5_ACTM4|nr:GntR family transcriptional regulator [Actinoplanes missouriensis]BAL88232.1 putative GntR-family transcriptional regulator [Actinoplanes missouriensis 431]